MKIAVLSAAVIDRLLSILPREWEGRMCISRMRDEGSAHCRQMEWPGWFFEHVAKRSLVDLLDVPGPIFGNAQFDAFRGIPWDFKVHSEQAGSKVIVNDREAIVKAVSKYGSVGLVLARGTAVYDDDVRSFQRWHDAMKGRPSAYVLARIARGAPSRRRKAAFSLSEISVINVSAEVVKSACNFQLNFRNADGSARRSKILLDLEQCGEYIICRRSAY